MELANFVANLQSLNAIRSQASARAYRTISIVTRAGSVRLTVCTADPPAKGSTKKVLAEISFFLETEGLPSTTHLNKQTGVYNLSVSGAERVAKVIKQTEPFIRTENKLEEIAEFERSISKPRQRLWPSIRNSRDILGLTET